MSQGETSYTVVYERTPARQRRNLTRSSRATQIYGREDGLWKVAHRHVDALGSGGAREVPGEREGMASGVVR
jgi:hypothetical protein